MLRPILVALCLTAPAAAQQAPEGCESERPVCASGTLYDPGTKTCEPVSS